MSFFSRKKTNGFTLIEVMVAIAVIGFAVPAVMLLMMQLTDSAGAIRDKTIANWIAENKATELRLERVFLQQLLQREQTEKIEMAGTEWTVDVDIDKAQIWIRYRIKVSRDPDKPLATLDTYLHDT